MQVIQPLASSDPAHRGELCNFSVLDGIFPARRLTALGTHLGEPEGADMNEPTEEDRTDYPYTLAKFSRALEKLATEPGDILARLPIAAREIAGIGPSHVPDHLSKDVRWIKAQVGPEVPLD